MQALQNKSATMRNDIPLIVRGQDASISTGSVKAAVRWVQDSHTSAVSEATKSYCGLRMKSCPRSCANLESQINREEYSDWKWTNNSAAYCKCGGTWWQAQRRWSCTQGSALTGEGGDRRRLRGGERADSRETEHLPTLPVCHCWKNIQLLSGRNPLK